MISRNHEVHQNKFEEFKKIISTSLGTKFSSLDKFVMDISSHLPNTFFTHTLPCLLAYLTPFINIFQLCFCQWQEIVNLDTSSTPPLSLVVGTTSQKSIVVVATSLGVGKTNLVFKNINYRKHFKIINIQRNIGY
jgi:hypothetical protein